jgi:hypothetical protein
MPTNDVPAESMRQARRESIVAWTSDVVACLYFAWLFGIHWRNVGMFASMFEGLGAQLPLPTLFVINQSRWLFPALFLLFSGFVVGKEPRMRDKRLSVMLTFLATMIGQFVSAVIVEAYYLPLRQLVGKLS